MAVVQEHVDACALCRAASSALVTASREEPAALSAAEARPRLAAGALVDRFVILHELGEGAASVVYAAYDPELDRKVALKLLRSRGPSVDDKLLREGRALAKLSHPNVVSVYEVGDADGQLYIALELVAGVTVRQWTKLTSRRWREIRDVYVAAARGLAALHRVGLVHRDVKPDNIVVAADGQVRLVDFGLVGAGAGAGTPAYMAPEGNVDARSDLYSLCAALAESLGGREAIDTPGRLAVPRRVRGAIARGMSRSPGQRFASADAWITAIVDRPAWRVAVPAAVLAGVGATAVAWSAANGHGPSCAVASPWTAAERAAILVPFERSARPHARDTERLAVTRLERFATTWSEARRALCTSYTDRREISAERYDRHVACLERVRQAFSATVTRLGRVSDDTVDHAMDLVGALPVIEHCREEAASARTEPLPTDPAARAAIANVELQLATVEAAHHAGDDTGALALAQSALAEARRVAYRPLIARASHHAADLLERAGKVSEASALLDEAIAAAAAARDDELEARAWTLQLFLLGSTRNASVEEREAARRAADAAVARARDPLVRARYLNTLGLVLKRQGDFAGARDQTTAALALVREAKPDGHEVAATLVNLSAVLSRLGDLEGARAAAEEATVRDREMFGSRHPSYASSLLTLASRETEVGQLAAAAKHADEALAIDVATYGPESGPVMRDHNNLASAFGQAGKLTEALPHARRAVELAEKLHGPDNPVTAEALFTLANIEVESGSLERGQATARRAAGIASTAFGPDHPMVASIRANLGIWAMRRHDFATAEMELRGALQAMQHLGDTPSVATIRTVLGDALVQRGKVADGIRELEAALVTREKIGDDPLALAGSRWTLARALWTDPSQRRRATVLAQQAIDVFVEVGAPAEPYLADVRKWIATTRAKVTIPS